MNKKYSEIKLALTLGIVLTVSALGIPVSTASDGGFSCSNQTIAGRWLFATDVGQQFIQSGLEGDITAMGTMNIDMNGNLSGEFDFNIHDGLFVSGVPFTGTVIVNPNCTGSLQFTTGNGGSRSDSIVVLGRGEMLGMSQSTKNLWTYQIRRIPGSPATN